MTIQTNKRALIAGLLVAGMVAAGTLATSPAHSSTTFTVNETGDRPDASLTGTDCDTDVFTNGDQCTLRAAIQQANATSGADAINFNIPGTGVKTIAVGSQGFGGLPEITEQVTIGGYTQPGAHPNTKAIGNDASLKIVLDGSNAGLGRDGLAIDGASNSAIKGLVINRFGGSGIDVFGGGPVGIVGTRIEGNFIGTDPTGALDRGNGSDGVSVFAGDISQTVVGGTTPASRNVVSGNGTAGIDLINNSGTRVLGNRIGTTAGGTGALGNGFFGVFVQGFGDTGSGNSLGDGTAAGSNTIAFNKGDGVEVASGSGNEISRNSIFSNAGLGIDLRGPGETDSTDLPTANDPLDADTGPNGLQNKPVISSAKTLSGKTTITGKLSSRPDSGYDLRFYSNPSGTDEGKKFIGQKLAVKTDASGNASFTFSPGAAVSAGQTVTATATSVNLDASHGDTSEFSAPKKVAS